MPEFDYVSPDYAPIWATRIERLAKLRGNPELLAACKLYYRDNIADFINDWGVTVNPKNAVLKLPVQMPFILFPKQREFVSWVIERMKNQESGVLVKSREVGASWMAFAIAITMCLFWEDVSIGFGSATEDKVDKVGEPDSLFYKGRQFLTYIPREFKPGWDLTKHASHMTMRFPWTGSTINGGAGDRIGRGGRKTMWFIDEYAFVERPKLVEANLVAATDCVIEMSSVNGLNNVFAEHARGGKMPRFDLHYRDDPRKMRLDETGVLVMRPIFAALKVKTDPKIWNQEFEADFLASAEGIIIPQEWVQACVGAAQKLGVKPSGDRRVAYDVGDRGNDKNCSGVAHGVELVHIESWAGGPTTIFKSVQRVFRYCEEYKVSEFYYDADGIGGGVRGDAEKVNEERVAAVKPELSAMMFRGSAAVADPEDICPDSDRTNKDFFANYKAQCWWNLRQRARRTWQWVVHGTPCDPDEILSISPDLPELTKTCAELSQPLMTWNLAGKLVVDKQPDDVASPNNGDCVMMLFQYSRGAMNINESVLEDLDNATHQRQIGQSPFGEYRDGD
jgi:phage terminase large subunit